MQLGSGWQTMHVLPVQEWDYFNTKSLGHKENCSIKYIISQWFLPKNYKSTSTVYFIIPY